MSDIQPQIVVQNQATELGEGDTSVGNNSEEYVDSGNSSELDKSFDMEVDSNGS